MQQSPPTRKRGHWGRWFVTLIALLEIAVLAGIFMWMRGGACGIPTAQTFVRMFASGGANDVPPVVGGSDRVSQQPAAGTQGNGDASNAAPGKGASVSGDLNEVPDPNCVAKTTAGLLNSGDATTPPSCAPMSPPPALRQAAGQVQNQPQPEQT
jgi:hypothetical protein